MSSLAMLDGLDPNGDVILHAIRESRKLADKHIIAGLEGRSVSAVSDVHIAAKEPITLRINGDLISVDPERPITAKQIEAFIKDTLNVNETAAIGAETVMYESDETGTIRVHITETIDGAALAIRLLPTDPPSLSALNMPKAVNEMPAKRRGLACVVGPTGSGKTTLLGAVTNEINKTRGAMIVTIDEGVEFRHRSDKSRVRQIEVGANKQAPTYRDALKNLLRADPDVVIVSECRDPESLEAALMIAEAGRRCVITVHVDSATGIVDRIVGAFPAEAQPQVRVQLAATLTEVVVMRLVPTRNGKSRVPACEIMLRTEGLASAILSPNEQSTEAALKNLIEQGANKGMILMEDSLLDLVADGIVDLEVAREYAIRPSDFESKYNERNKSGRLMKGSAVGRSSSFGKV
jgi:twitching motility protein PilT